MKRTTALAAVALSLSATFSMATQAEALDEQMLKCFEVTSQDKRITCYDDIARSLAKADPAKQEMVKKRAQADFGLANQEQSFDEMTLETQSVKRSPDGLWTITMKNGQIWQQTKEQRFRFSSDQPKVRIFKLLLGSYAMTEEGKSKKIRVKRLK